MNNTNNEYTDPFTAERINDEPEVYKGLTSSEWGVLLKSGSTYALGFIVGFTVLFWPIASLLSIIPAMGFCYFILTRMMKQIPVIRDGKPPGYLDHYVGNRGFIGLVKLTLGGKKKEIESDMVMYSLGREGVSDDK